MTAETKISFELSDRAKVELKILDDDGSRVVTIVDNETINAGEHFVWWNGTDRTSDSGTVVAPGRYHYKIIAKDPTTSEQKATATDSINVNYAVANDFENRTTTDTTTTTTNTATNNIGTTQGQNSATMAMQNSTMGATASTGPGVFVYFLFPLGGYFISRKKK